MAKNAARSILARQLDARKRLWPNLNAAELWQMDNDGWVAVPRLMPLMLSIMDDLAGVGQPVGRTYLEIWSRMRIEESFVTLNRPEEMAFHAGFEGQRALRTWKDRMQRLNALGFIDLKDGPIGEFSYAVVYNPYHIIKRFFLKGEVQPRKWQALAIRSIEVGAYDIDEIDDDGLLVAEPEEEPAEKPATSIKKRRGGRRSGA